ncbi:hypothetical protein RP20_CCG024713 [Aedes albopictus]|nr:hypothetical protein RP20_CCG024713 [Aedes albopictus]
MNRKEWRKLLKKVRRKRIRQKLAQARDSAAAESEALRLVDPNYVLYLREKEQLDRDALEREEERRRYENALWLDREREAQAAFAEKRRKLEEEQREENEKRDRIRKEFEEMERKAKAAKAERERLMEEYRKKQQERERMFAEYLVGIDDHLEVLRESSHSRPDRNPCVFFGKVGACRYGARCSSDHPTPGISELLLMPNFFTHPALDHQQHPEYGLDSSIEFDDDELYRCFTEFFMDIIEEFESFGSINGIFVTRNYEPHLRGNVYVQYEKIRDAAKAYQRMNGRFYASKQLRVEFRSPIVWTAAVCGLFERSRCQKGKSCNYLHLLVNPVAKYRYNHFKELQSVRQSQRQSQRSQLIERSWDDIDVPLQQRTNWRWSETPEIERPSRRSRLISSPTSTSERYKNRSRSRESSRSNERRSSRSRHSKPKSRSRSRHRSRERRKERRKPHSRSRSRSRDRKKSKKRVKRSRSRSRESRASRERSERKSSKRRN